MRTALLTALMMASCSAAVAPAADAAKRRDLASRAEELSVVVSVAELDPLQATLRLHIQEPDGPRGVTSYVIYRLGSSGGWQRLRALPRGFWCRYPQAAPADAPADIDVSMLPNGAYTLELRRVEGGNVYQRDPDQLTFTIDRDPPVIHDELTGCLISGDESAESAAVRFLAPRLEAYADRLARELSGDRRAEFLVNAARDRAIYGQEPGPDALPPLRYLVRHEGQREVWDLSEYPELDPAYSKRMLTDADAKPDIGSLVFDGRRLWLTHSAGVGALCVETGEVRWYGGADGLPGAATGGIRIAGAADLYVGTERGLALLDPTTDRFYRIERNRRYSTNHRALAVDAHGRLWSLQTESGGGVAVYDGNRWLRSPSLRLSGMTSDAQGKIWLLGRLEREGQRHLALVPACALAEGLQMDSHPGERPFVDYLDRLFIIGHRGSIRTDRYAWPGEDHELATPDGSYDYGVADAANRELWVLEDDMLINDTRRHDPAMPADERWALPLPPTEARFWRFICYVNAEHIYLAGAEGLLRWDGESWSRVELQPPSGAVAAPAWPRWPQPYWTDGRLFRYEDSRRIEIADPFPGRRAPAGRYYEIVERDNGREYWLIEETADGQVREYQFQPPFHYYPHVLFADYEGNIWAAGTHYLYRFDGERIATLTAKDHAHFDNDHIYSFAVDPWGNVWIGTERGLALFRDGQFVPPPKKFSGKIFALAYDCERDWLIVAESWNGLHIFCDGQWTHHVPPSGAHGSHDRMVRSISVADDGTLWLATNAGAVSCSPDMRRWARYGDEFTEGVILADDGRVFVHAQPSYVLVPKAAGDR